MRVLPPLKSIVVGLAPVVMAAALMFTAAALPSAVPGAAPVAAAANCPQVQVVFARGRLESPGPASLGNAFISALALQGRARNFDSTR